MIPAVALAQFAPIIAGWLSGPKAEAVAGKVVDIALAVTGKSDPDAAVRAIQSDNGLATRFQQQVLDSQVQIAADVEKANIAGETENKSDINETMRAEARAEHWPTWSWRPMIGFAVAFVLFAAAALVIGVFIAVVIKAEGAQEAIAQLPSTIAALVGLVGVASPILGIASYFRGKMQSERA